MTVDKPGIDREKESFSEMVEILESAEDTVECKECFELFPKADCVKTKIGYMCKNCTEDAGADVEVSPNITTELFSVDFPDVVDYDPTAIKSEEVQPSIADIFDELLQDEYRAIESYDVAEEIVDHSSIENRDQILDTLAHIKAEEEEHVDELKDELQKLCHKPAENSSVESGECADLEEDLFKLTGVPEIDKFNNALRYAKRDKVPYIYGYMSSSGEVVLPVRPLKIEGDQATFEVKFREVNPDAETLYIAYPDKSYRGQLEESSSVETAVSTYDSAAEVASKKNVAQVYGYTNKDGEFVSVDLFDCVDPSAAEETLKQDYPDYDMIHIAYPKLTLQESYEKLFEQKLDELWTYPKASKVVDEVCSNGYTVGVVDDSGALKTDSSMRKSDSLVSALKTAAALSKQYPKNTVHVVANAIPQADLAELDPAFKEFFAQRPGSKYAIVLTQFKAGKEVASRSKIKDFQSKYKVVKKTSKALDKHSSAVQPAPAADETELAGEENPTPTPVEEPVPAPVEEPDAPPTEEPDAPPVEEPTPPAEPDTPPADRPRSKVAIKRARQLQNKKIRDALKAAGIAETELAKLSNDVMANLRKAILGESLEDGEQVVCAWCDERYDRDECRKEVDFGWLCDRCEQAIKSRGGILTFEEPVHEMLED